MKYICLAPYMGAHIHGYARSSVLARRWKPDKIMVKDDVEVEKKNNKLESTITRQSLTCEWVLSQE